MARFEDVEPELSERTSGYMQLPGSKQDIQSVRIESLSPSNFPSVGIRASFFEQKRAGHVFVVGHGHFYAGTSLIEATNKQFRSVLLDKFNLSSQKTMTKDAFADAKKVEKGKKGAAFSETVTHYDTGVKNGLAPVSGLIGAPQNEQERRLQKEAIQHAGKFQVPLGVTIHFYVPHGVALQNDLANLVEGVSTRMVFQPSLIRETIKGGQWCWNYRLTYPIGLKLNMTALQAKYDMITIPRSRSWAEVPLSVIVRDSRCAGAELHWMACRSEKIVSATSPGAMPDSRNESRAIGANDAEWAKGSNPVSAQLQRDKKSAAMSAYVNGEPVYADPYHEAKFYSVREMAKDIARTTMDPKTKSEVLVVDHELTAEWYRLAKDKQLMERDEFFWM